jgi:hypothetical protein
MEMRFYKVRELVQRKQFDLKWRSNQFSLADYLTKAIPAKQSLYLRQFYYKPTAKLYLDLEISYLPKIRHINEITPPGVPKKNKNKKNKTEKV